MSEPVDLPPELGELLELAREQAPELTTLAPGPVAAWASDLLALADEAAPQGETLLVEALRSGGDLAALDLAVLDAIEALRSGTSRCDGAWEMRARGSSSAVLRFVDGADECHVVSVDLVPAGAGEPEVVGEVVVGPGDLLDVLTEEDARIESVEVDPGSLARRIAAALAATRRPTLSAVANGRLLAARLAPFVADGVVVPRPAPEVVPPVPARDPDVDAWALDIVSRACPDPEGDGPAQAVVVAAAEPIAPSTLEPLGPAERDAVLTLEVADWLGAVLELVREGPGAPVDGETMVAAVNRCPEVASTIPGEDRARIAWAFALATAPWVDLGLVEGGHLTTLGAEVLPRALRRALGG